MKDRDDHQYSDDYEEQIGEWKSMYENACKENSYLREVLILKIDLIQAYEITISTLVDIVNIYKSDTKREENMGQAVTIEGGGKCTQPTPAVDCVREVLPDDDTKLNHPTQDMTQALCNDELERVKKALAKAKSMLEIICMELPVTNERVNAISASHCLEEIEAIEKGEV